MKLILVSIILILSLTTVIPLYNMAFEYSNFLYWSAHVNDYKCDCTSNSVCSCPVDTASECIDLYWNDDPFFNKLCTTTKWDDPYWIIQITAIFLSMIPTFVSSTVLLFIHYRYKKLK